MALRVLHPYNLGLKILKKDRILALLEAADAIDQAWQA
jgi:hypothetical protein